MAVSKRVDINGPTWVYVCLCSHGGLLYVGVARNLRRRIQQHRASKSWWSDVDQVLGDLYNTRQDALQVERHKIWHDHPVHNIQGYNGKLTPCEQGDLPRPTAFDFFDQTEMAAI